MNYIERKIQITPKSVALIKENLLNDIAEVLYTNGDVSTKFTFAIEYDEVRWRRFERKALEPDSTRIQGVLKVNGSTPVSGDYLQYTEYYTTTFISTYKHRDELEIIFREYQAYESTEGKLDVTNINAIKYTIVKNIDGAIMPNKTDALDGSGEDKAYYFLSDNWSYSTYVLNSEDLELTINDNKIDYLSIIYDVSKETLASDSKTNTGKLVDKSPLTENNLSVILPLISSNLAHKDLFRDSRKKELVNKKYEIKLTLEGEVILEEEMELTYSAFTDRKPSPLVFSLMFRTVSEYQRVQIKRAQDNTYQDLTYSEIRMEKGVSGPQDPAILEDSTVKTLPAIASRSLYLLVPLKKERIAGEDIEVDLEIDHYSDNINSLYDIRITKHGISFEYKMLLTNSIISYSDKADEYLGLTFVDRRDL